MKAFKIVPKEKEYMLVFAETKGEALVGFASEMDSDMNQYFEAIEITEQSEIDKWIKERTTYDASLKERFELASEELEDEDDFFWERVEEGFTLDDIKKYAPEYYESSKQYMEELGLI